MSLALVPFQDAFLDAAAGIFAERHRRDRAREPALPARFAALDGAAAAVGAAWRAPDAYGVAALRDGRLVGFLIGAPNIDEAVWGRSIWMPLGGHALAPTEDADLYRDLYAALAPHWLALGCFAHYVEVPATDRPALDAWFALSFGQQQAYALREVAEVELPAPPPPDPAITIRRAGPADLEAVLAMQAVLFEHLGLSPVYSVRLPEARRDWPAGYVEDLADPDVAIWLAVREGDGVVLGAVEFAAMPAADDAPSVPERCCTLAMAATRPDARGHGISRRLTAHGLAEARAAGYAYCFTDWRTTNLPSSRLWPRLGFRPVHYRLHRLIDDRIAWAPGLSV